MQDMETFDGPDMIALLANIRLCDAAPDLLNALEDAEFLMRVLSNNPREVPHVVDSLKRSASDARAAIAKARGE